MQRVFKTQKLIDYIKFRAAEEGVRPLDAGGEEFCELAFRNGTRHFFGVKLGDNGLIYFDSQHQEILDKYRKSRQ